jgi:hypothetical protein
MSKTPWQASRDKSGWNGGYVEWLDGKTAYQSIVFSWLLPEAYWRAAWLRSLGYSVVAGGPAVYLRPDFMKPVTEVCEYVEDAISRHNPNATFTSRGCIRQCRFCAVPKLEGELHELDDWPLRPIVCDNNFLATSRKHFDDVIDKLKLLKGIDFNQGLDARLLTRYHAGRFAELNVRTIRLSWDIVEMGSAFMKAFDLLLAAGFPAKKISVYILIGFMDTPEDALYRLQIVRNLGAWPFPMRYQPIDAKIKNEFVGEHWTHKELQRFVRYWCNLRHTSKIPFGDFIG